MKIKEIKVDRYGPLKNLSLSFDEKIQPIYGPNESGKTLLLDFLTKKLVGKEASKDIELNRVEEQPEGYIVLKDDKNKDIKLERKETLAEFLELSPHEIRNIFLIRDTDLKIPNENKFYENITDKLTGLKSEAARKISKKLLELGRLTDGKALSDSRDNKKAKTNVDDAKKLRDKIEEYLKNAEIKDYAEIERNIFLTKKNIEEKKQKKLELEKAKEKDEFLDLQNRVSGCKEKLETGNIGPSLEQITDFIKKVEEFDAKSDKKAKYKQINKVSFWSTLITIVVVGVIWILWAVFVPPILGIITPILLTGFLTMSTIGWIKSLNFIYACKEMDAELKEKARNYNLDFDTINELKEKLYKLKEQKELSKNKFLEDLGVIKRELNLDESCSNQEAVNIAQEELKKQKEKIDLAIKTKYNKKKYEEVIKELEENEEKLKTFEEELEKHKNKIVEFNKDAYKLDFSTFLERNLELEIKNLDSLRKLLIELEEFIEEIESNAEYCKIAIEIFEEIECEEKEEITKLFDASSSVSKIFSKLTDNKYTSVKYDKDKGAIIVVKATGEELTANKLSKGTFDQLYLALRIDLAQRLLGKKKAFFIMDDTFLAADNDRFEKGIKELSTLVEMGWQIIYFTTKKSDSEKLSKVSKVKVLELKPLP